MKNIPITRLEMQLILEEIHPEYNSQFEDEYLERGKGADVHYERKVIRLADGEELKIGFTHNSDVGYQDWMRTGNFTLDHQKEDIYNEYGELIVTEKNESEPVQENEDEKKLTIFEEYAELQKNGEIADFDDDSWLHIPIASMMVVFYACKVWIKKPTESGFNAVRDTIFTIAVKEKVNADRLWRETFNNTKLTKSSLSEKRVQKYFENLREYSKNKNHLMTMKEVEDLQKYAPKYLKF